MFISVPSVVKNLKRLHDTVLLIFLPMISKYGRKTLCLFHFTGSSAWPSGVFLKYTSGDQLGPVNLVSVKPLDPGEYYDLSINMISPSKMGMYQGQWRMCNPAGQYFGGELNKMNLYYSTFLLCVCVFVCCCYWFLLFPFFFPFQIISKQCSILIICVCYTFAPITCRHHMGYYMR